MRLFISTLLEVTDSSGAELVGEMQSIIPDVIGNFVEGSSNSVEGSAHLNNCVMSCQSLKLVGGCHKGQACVLGHSSCKGCVKALLGVQTCTSAHRDADGACRQH